MNKRIRKKRDKQFKAAFARAFSAVDWEQYFADQFRLESELMALFAELQ